ncbi:hypothetical protein UlMin_037303 [Ulmus minor]
MEINKRDPPQVINHSFHHHTLIYGNRGSYYCDSCHKFFKDAPSYRCCSEYCGFDLDVKCAMMEPIRCEGQEHIEHFSHQHPMPLVQIDPQHHIQCFACQSLCSGPTFACKKCEYFLHKSCAELPLQIQHPAHSFHPLFLRVWHYRSFTCNICGKRKKNTFIYECKQCFSEFNMCVKCCHECLLSLRLPFIKPSIKYRYHEHLLCFIEEYYDHITHCKASDNYCHQPKASYDLHHTPNSLFLCMNCDFKIHFICGPLPSTIKLECHMHPLNLVDSVVEANSNENYCDVCEFERNPRIRAYYCEECQYIAHPYCVISEIVKVFKGDLGGVKLKVIGQDSWVEPEEEWDMSSSLTLLDLLSSNHLAEHEKDVLNNYFKWDKSSKGEEDSKVEVADEDIDEIITRYPFFNQQEDLTSFFYKDFRRFIYTWEKLVVKSSDLSLKIVGVQGYSIPVTLAPVLQTLLHKYPDISSDSECTPAMKSIFFFFLCKVINSMHTTRFADITKNLLRDWYYYLEFVGETNFSIDFVKQHLKMITRAFVGVQLARLETEIPTKLNNKIVELQQEIAGLEEKVELCNKRFESSSDLEFIKDNLRIGAELKWKTAGLLWF